MMKNMTVREGTSGPDTPCTIHTNLVLKINVKNNFYFFCLLQVTEGVTCCTIREVEGLAGVVVVVAVVVDVVVVVVVSGDGLPQERGDVQGGDDHDEACNYQKTAGT